VIDFLASSYFIQNNDNVAAQPLGYDNVDRCCRSLNISPER
jgi:hypothetical protein